jgi:hypothetical protein
MVSPTRTLPSFGFGLFSTRSTISVHSRLVEVVSGMSHSTIGRVCGHAGLGVTCTFIHPTHAHLAEADVATASRQQSTAPECRGR